MEKYAVNVPYIIDMAELILESIIKYPECGFEKQEIMPTEACMYFTNAPIASFY